MLWTRRLALLVCTTANAACAATSGQDWLDTPIDATSATAAGVAAPGLPQTEARPRLRHSITLGESYVDAAPTVRAAPTSDSAVHISVQTYVPVTVNHYGSYGYDYGARAPERTSPSRTVQPGQDFPAPPSYGPSFPYHTAPASPWAR